MLQNRDRVGVRLLHSADWQLGKQFKGLGGDPDNLSDLRKERLSAVYRLGSVAMEQQADAVLVAGDVFEMNDVSDRLIRQTLNTLAGFDVPWVLLPGNHDSALAESVWTRIERIGRPANVHLALTRATILLANEKLAVLPAPLLRRHESADPTQAFAATETRPGAIRVGLAHGSVKNRLPAEAEQHNIISDSCASDANLDYLALGDWHGTLEIAPRTWYSGTPEPDGFRQENSGHALLVDIDSAGANPRIRQIDTGRFRWRQLDLNCSSTEPAIALDHELTALGEPLSNLVVRLNLRGTISLRGRSLLENTLQAWEARVHLLRVNTDNLAPEPSNSDFEDLGRQGFIGDVVERLRSTQNDPAHPDQAFAGAALQRLYSEHVLGR